MQQIEDFSDKRNKAWCVHCGRPLIETETNRDHVPSKALLREPYPPNLPVVSICRRCNDEFSADEEYFASFIGCVLSGSTDPEQQTDPRVSRILLRSPALRHRIEQSRVQRTASDGTERFHWIPEKQRIDRVVLKNARGHALFEFGEPMFGEPAHLWCAPLPLMTAKERFDFERWEWDGLYPEVGSRALTRGFSGHDLVDGWVQVQEGAYRYMVAQRGGLVVRTVVGEYLATEVSWQDWP